MSKTPLTVNGAGLLRADCFGGAGKVSYALTDARWPAGPVETRHVKIKIHGRASFDIAERESIAHSIDQVRRFRIALRACWGLAGLHRL